MPLRTVETGELLEREAVLGAVRTCLDQALIGRGHALFVIGEAGLGKTRVIEEAGRLARGRLDVSAGRGESMEQAIAFGLFGQVLQGLDDAPDVTELGITPVVEPSAPYHRTLRWLERRRERPLLVLLDDVHWADADSLTLLSFVVRRLRRLPVAVVATLRPWPPEAEKLCQDLASGGDAAVERLSPLGERSVRALLTSLTGEAVSKSTAHRAHALCNGNPMLIEQVALSLARGGDVPDLGGTASGLGQHILLARFAGLDAAGIRCAQSASVLGTSFRLELAAQLAAGEGPSVDEAFDGLFRSGLVVDAGDGIARFVHPLFGQAVYEDISPPLRRRLHARAFAVLAERGLDAEASEHALRAQLTGDGTAIASLLRAGRASLAAGALGGAARTLEGAMRLSGDRPTPELLLAYCEALTASGKMDDATAACRRLLAEPGLRWEDRVQALRMLGRSLFLTGAPDHGAQALDEAVAVALTNDPTLAVQPLLDQSLSAWLAAGPENALPLAVRARELAAGADRALRERAEATWGHLALQVGDGKGLAATEPLARHVETGLPEGPLSPAELAWPWASIYQFAMNESYSGRLDTADRTFKLARTIAERAGAANALATLAVYIAHLAIRRGRLDEALHEANRSREFAELTPGVLAYSELVRAEALLWLGRLDESEEACAQAERRAPDQWFARLWLSHVRGTRQLWEGEDTAAATFLTLEKINNAAGIREPCHVHWASHAISAHLASGHVDDAARLVGWLDACATSLTCRWPRIAAELGRAQLAARAGDGGTAEEHFQAALALHEQVDLPLQRVEALLAYAAFLRRHGRPVDARNPAAEALRLATSCYAGRLEQAAREQLALAGGRRRRDPGARDSLTPAEERVAELAAAGDTNAEIARRLHLSVNTVETHLKHVYAKLGIRSRRQLLATEDGVVAATGERAGSQS